MGFNHTLTSEQKALQINLNKDLYGSFAEIGAGQEVARHFFRAGGAAGTIAQTFSAYDMDMSDHVYGRDEGERYVSDKRLRKMLKHEFSHLITLLKDKRDKETCFFSFANTVAAKSYKGTGDCHGWLGVRFQHEASSEFSDVILHVKLHDKKNTQQQLTLGTCGVNLIYACFHYQNDREKFISSLIDNTNQDSIEVDMVHVSGPAFNDSDANLFALELVKQGLTNAIMFDEKGIPSQPKDSLYRKNVLVLRGSFRPPTLVNLDMLETGKKKFVTDWGDKASADLITMGEISMSSLRERGDVDSSDFLARVKLLNALGIPVLISNYPQFHRLSTYLSSIANGKISFVLGVYNVMEILDAKKYKDHSDGFLGGLGAMFGLRKHLYVYPGKDDDTDKILTLENMELLDYQRSLLNYLKDNGLIHDIKDYNKNVFNIWSRIVLEKIQKGEKGWESMVPEEIAKTVKKDCLFGYPCEI